MMPISFLDAYVTVYLAFTKPAYSPQIQKSVDLLNSKIFKPILIALLLPVTPCVDILYSCIFILHNV
jgi:hypothetical protein